MKSQQNRIELVTRPGVNIKTCLVPIFTGEHLEDGEESDVEGVEVGGWCSLREIEGSPKELHPQQSEDENEKEEEKEEGEDGPHGTQQGYHKVAQRRPVPGT